MEELIYMNRFNNVFLYMLAAYSGIFFYIRIATRLGKNKTLPYFGKYSLVIMCTHVPIKREVIQIASIVTYIPSDALRNNILLGLLFVVIILLIEVIAVEILRFLSKVTIGKRFISYLSRSNE